MTPIGQPLMCEPMTWLYFVFVQSVFVFVGQTLTMAGLARSIGVSNFQRRHLEVGLCTLNSVS
jgi:hypothetical protein